jgi:hypothetical protein
MLQSAYQTVILFLFPPLSQRQWWRGWLYVWLVNLSGFDQITIPGYALVWYFMLCDASQSWNHGLHHDTKGIDVAWDLKAPPNCERVLRPIVRRPGQYNNTGLASEPSTQCCAEFESLQPTGQSSLVLFNWLVLFKLAAGLSRSIHYRDLW